MEDTQEVEIEGVIPTDVLNNKIKVGGGKGNVGTGQIPKNKERINKEFRRGYGSGVNDVKSMNSIDIMRVVEGNSRMSMMVHYLHHGGEDVSEGYLDGWAQAIKDAHKRVGERQK